MAKSEWQVFCNYFSGRMVYRVGRIIDIIEETNEPLVEYYSDENTKNGWTDKQSEAEDLAIRLNGGSYGTD